MRSFNHRDFGPVRTFIFTLVFLIQVALSDAVPYNGTAAQDVHRLVPRFTVSRFDCNAEQTAMIRVAIDGAKQAVNSWQSILSAPIPIDEI